jgi:methionine-rich copper-binding protein CopC
MPGRSGASRPLRRRLAAVPAVLLIAGAVVAGGATAASAHTELTSSTPAQGQVLRAPLTAVTLTFGEAVGKPAFVTVTGPQGRVDDGAAQVDGAVVTEPVRAGAPDGRYTVAFRVVSDDGHPVEASYTFQLLAGSGIAGAAPTTPATVPAGQAAPLGGAAAPSATSPAAAAPAPAAAATVAPADAGTDHSSHWFMGFAGVAMVVAGAGALVYERRHREPDEHADDGVDVNA